MNQLYCCKSKGFDPSNVVISTFGLKQYFLQQQNATGNERVKHERVKRERFINRSNYLNERLHVNSEINACIELTRLIN